jgi:type III restriction enzyme
LFPQVLAIVQRYLAEKVRPLAPFERVDAFLSPYYGWIIERLLAALRPDAAAGEAPELPEVDEDRPIRTADVSVFTTKDVREAVKCHLNFVVNDTITWEQSAAYVLEHHPAVRSFVKNFGLNFTIPYLHNGKPSDYLPDFVARLNGDSERYLITEVKGADWDDTADIKALAAHRWCAAINAAKRFGHWDYLLVKKVPELTEYLNGQANIPGASSEALTA